MLQAYWTEFIQLSTIRQSQRDGADSWLRTCLRYVPISKHNSSTAVKSTKNADPAGKLCFQILASLFLSFSNCKIGIFYRSGAENIVRLLDSYDAPITPPIVPNEPLLVKKMSITELKRNVLRQMQNDFKRIDELSRMFHMDVQELSSLDATYKEMLRILHENKSRQERREVRCGSMLSSKSCKGGVIVNVNVS